MGIQQSDEPSSSSPDRGAIPSWPDEADSISVPGYDFTLLDFRNKLEGRRVRYLGFGTEGYVYLGESTKPGLRGSKLAIKFLTFRGTDHENRVNAFLEQVPNLITKVSSTNVAKTYEVLDLRQTPGWPPVAMVMDRLHCTLQDVRDAAQTWSQPLPTSLAVTWARQIVKGLFDLHEIGQVHRDVKATNIMFRLRDGARWKGRLEDLIEATAFITDLGTLAPLGQHSRLIVCRDTEFDPWKYQEFYPLYRRGEARPMSPQFCHPYMDVFAYGEVVSWLHKLTNRV